MAAQDDLRGFVEQELLDALKEIRQGTGWDIDDTQLAVVPDRVRRYLGIDTGGSLPEQLQHLSRLLRDAIDGLSASDRAWVRWAYNLEHHEDREWSDRLADMARDEGLDPRTIRERRVDPALGRLRDELLADNDRRRQRGASLRAADPPALAELDQLLRLRANFRVVQADVSLYLSRDRVEIREAQEVVANRDGVRDFLISRVLFHAGTTVAVEVTEAGRLVGPPLWHTDKWLLCVVRFPEPMAAGDQRHFVVTYTTRHMAPVFVSSAHGEAGRLTVRLQCKDVRPVTVWQIEHLPDDVLRATDLLPTVDRHAVRIELDRDGYYEQTFGLVDDTRSGLAWDIDGVVPVQRGGDNGIA